jgi:hypothetical protein
MQLSSKVVHISAKKTLKTKMTSRHANLTRDKAMDRQTDRKYSNTVEVRTKNKTRLIKTSFENAPRAVFATRLDKQIESGFLKQVYNSYCYEKC